MLHPNRKSRVLVVAVSFEKPNVLGYPTRRELHVSKVSEVDVVGGDAKCQREVRPEGSIRLKTLLAAYDLTK